MNIRYLVIFSIISMLTFTGCNSCSKKKEEKDITKIPVQVEMVAKRDLSKWLEISGNVKGDLEVAVYPEIAEQILSINVVIGDYVKVGQAIAVLKKGTLDDSLTQSQAGLEAAQARLDAAISDFERADELYKAGIASDSQLTAAKSAKDAAEALVKQLKAQVSQSQTIKDKTYITAPISGYIGSINYDEGSMASPQRPMCTISRLENIKVVAEASDLDLSFLKVGLPATAIVDGSDGSLEKAGKIIRVSPVINPISRTITIEAQFNNSDHSFRSGMIATLKIKTGEVKNAIAIPNKALAERLSNGTGAIFTIENNKAVGKEVQFGLKEDDYIEISSGLNEGENIVVVGQHLLKNGDQVQIIK